MNTGRGLSQLVLMVLVSGSPILAQVSSVRQEQQLLELRQQNADLKRQIAVLNAKLAKKLKPSTLDQQAKCADRAEKDFDDWGYKAKDSPDFVGHYNAKLDRCFVQFQNTLSGGEFLWRNLFDAYSGKSYGTYGWRRVDNKKYWEVPPFSCTVTQLSGEEKFCKSDAEFNELVRDYMGN